MEQLREGVMEQKLENEKTKKEIALLIAEEAEIRNDIQLESQKVQIQAANTKIGAEKIKVARETNVLTEKKIESDERVKKATAKKGK